MTTTEEATQLFHKAGEIAGWKPGVGNPLVINYLRIFADLVKAEENEACAKFVETQRNDIPACGFEFAAAIRSCRVVRFEQQLQTAGAAEPTILPDGSGFGILSFPLPKDHWLYKERAYAEGAVDPSDLPAPILTHSLRQQVIAAIRYAVRSATNCGKEDDFDPDALVQNAVYALCGPYGSAAPTPTSPLQC